MELLAGWIQLMQRELQTREWFDAFGDLFMALSSRAGSRRTDSSSLPYTSVT